MTWDEFKMKVDDEITEELGAGFNQGDVEIDYIDISLFPEPNIELVKLDNGKIGLRVLD
jgi:hypothetical protein